MGLFRKSEKRDYPSNSKVWDRIECAEGQDYPQTMREIRQATRSARRIAEEHETPQEHKKKR